MDILYEDNHLLAVNKKAGEIVQGDKTGDASMLDTIKAFIKKRDQKPGNVYLGLPHRIDRPTSGVVLFCKTDKSLSRVNQLIQERAFHKTYWAIVKTAPAEAQGHLIHYLKKNQAQNRSYAHLEPVPDSQRAELYYQQIAQSEHYTLLEIQLITGRHHQIRVQLSAIGCPIRGDLKYGFGRSNPDASISLHARVLELVHPIRQEPLRMVAPVPQEKLWQALEAEIKNTK